MDINSTVACSISSTAVTSNPDIYESTVQEKANLDAKNVEISGNFGLLNSTVMEIQKGGGPMLSKPKESSPPLKIQALSDQKNDSNQPIKEQNLLSTEFLQPIADFILNLHSCMQYETKFDELEKSIQTLSNSFKNSDTKERQLIIAQLKNKETKIIPRLLAAVEQCGEAALLGTVGELIYTCLSPVTSASVRHQLMSCLVQCNAAEILFRCLKNLPPGSFAKGDPGIVYGFQVVTKLASIDTKLAVKCRLLGGVKFIHQLLQSNSKCNPLLQALLMVLKFIAKNATNQVVLGKDGCVSTLISLLSSVQKNHWTKIKLIFENLSLLTKTTLVSARLAATMRGESLKFQALRNFYFESNVVRLVKENGVVKMLLILESWDKIDKRHQVKVLKSLLFTLSHLSDSKHGLKSIVSLNGLDVLHKFVLSCPLDVKFEVLLSNAITVFLKCSSKGELPVTSLKGAITFQIPVSSTISNQDSREVTPDLDVDSSDEEDEEEEEMTFDLKPIDLSSVYNPQTTQFEDLVKIAKYFPEFSNQYLASQRTTSKGTANSIGTKDAEMYLHEYSEVKSLINFVKVAYPDLIGAEGPPHLEPLYQKTSKVLRDKVLRTLDRVVNASHYNSKVVFDLDYLLESEQSLKLIIPPTSAAHRNISNWDEKRLDKKDVSVNHLNFESRFESGNLRRAIQIADYEYDLVLNSDVNSFHHHQWFYFEVSNMEKGVPYILNIINNEKPNSEFNFGMKPVMLSVKECQNGHKYWFRTGEDICYHKNHFLRPSKQNDKTRKGSGKSYFTASITVTFPHENDVVYMAYHYPYTYTKLQTLLSSVEVSGLDPDIYFLNQTLCPTLNGNSVPVLTITNNAKRSQEKDVVFLTARVHPGETNSSWMMEGVIKFLLGSSDEAKELRNAFVFKIIPMLNPEGVIHGNQRCGLTDEDLNRRWRSPNLCHHPTIYYAKAMIEHLATVLDKKPRIFCDFHGHSRQKNVFMYGCSRLQSWWPSDKDQSDPTDLWLLPRLCELQMATFSVSNCRLQIERAKESTARVAIWRQFQISNSFTIEASTCGCDRGPYKDHHLSPLLLLESGEGFCKALHSLAYDSPSYHQRILSTRVRKAQGEAKTSEGSDDELDYDMYGCYQVN